MRTNQAPTATAVWPPVGGRPETRASAVSAVDDAVAEASGTPSSHMMLTRSNLPPVRHSAAFGVVGVAALRRCKSARIDAAPHRSPRQQDP